MDGTPQLATLERVVDSLSTPVFVVKVTDNGDIRYLLANRHHERASGLPSADLVGRTPQELLSPEIVDQVVERYRACARDQKTIEYDYCLIAEEATTWWHIVLAPWDTRADGSRILIGSSTEITLQKQVEQDMQRSRERLSLALTGADLGLWDWDIASGNVHYSTAWQDLLCDATPLAPTLDAWLDRVHPEEAEQVRALLNTHLANPGSRFQSEHRLRQHDGDWVWVSVKGRALFDSRRQPYRMSGIVQSIAVQKDTEAAKEESDRRFRTLMEGSLQGILIHRAYRPLFVNQAFARIYGYNSVEAVMRERCLLHLIGPDQEDEAAAQWAEALNDPDYRLEVEARHSTRSGQSVWVQVMGRRIEWMGAPAIQLTVIDISERKKFEMQLLESRNALERQANELARLAQDLDVARRQAERHGAEAEAANRAKSQFLATMSHELRTPLNAILGFAEIISKETFGPVGLPEYTEYASDILSSGKHLLDLINDILDLAKIESGRLELSPEYIHLEEVMESCLRLSRMRAIERNVELELAIAPGAEQLHADERAVRQIVFNLVSNAIKFTPPGGKVMLEAEHNARGEVVVSVSDTGIGIARKDLDRVLQPFEQVDNSYNRGTDGTGLGLALVKSLTTLHGGSLEIDSEPGEGTSVRVTFPAYTEAAIRTAS